MHHAITLILEDGGSAVFRLRKRFWCYRSFLISNPRAEYRVDCNIARNAINVRLERVCQNSVWRTDRRQLQWIQCSDPLQPLGGTPWFRRRCDLTIAAFRVQIDLVFWPWMSYRGFLVQIEEQVAYAEGSFADHSPPISAPFGDLWDNELDAGPV